MERGELGVSNSPATVFVFEGLLADLLHPRMEQTALRMRRWSYALDQWAFDLDVLTYVENLISRHNVPVDVLTWRPIEFAELLYDRLWYYDTHVRSVKASTYPRASQQIATNDNFTLVYDPDPSHRWGYGFKAREFNIGQL